MRTTLYSWFMRLPLKIGGAIGWAIGLLAAGWPNRIERLAGDSVTAETIHNAGVALLAFSSVYFAALWILKPTGASSVGGVTFTGNVVINHYSGISDKVATDETITQPAITGSLNVTEEGDTVSATATVAFRSLYVGNIIVAAGALRDTHRLEIAVRGFNDTSKRLVIGEIGGHIRAGSGNLRDFEVLSPPIAREVIHCDPASEFLLILDQDVSAEQATEYLEAFEERQVGLDLRQLTIKATCNEDASYCANLALWDGVNLRRRDDIVSNRNIIVTAVGAAYGIGSARAVGKAIAKDEK